MGIAESEFRRFQRYQRPFSIMILDADRFKRINDTYGHHAGDLALRSLSLVAMEQKRAQDTFGRLGGEEFGLLLPETPLDRAVVVAERICPVWEVCGNLDGELIRSTMSIGVAESILPTNRSRIFSAGRTACYTRPKSPVQPGCKHQQLPLLKRELLFVYRPPLWRMRNTINAAARRMAICTLGRMNAERRRYSVVLRRRDVVLYLLGICLLTKIRMN